MKRKRILCPERLRKIPTQFSWVDHRLVRDGYLNRCHPEALALYLFLVTVGDAYGLSYYGDPSVEQILRMSSSVLVQAREGLQKTGLIAYENPIYQVLGLERSPSQLPRKRCIEPVSIQSILTRVMRDPT